MCELCTDQVAVAAVSTALLGLSTEFYKNYSSLVILPLAGKVQVMSEHVV